MAGLLTRVTAGAVAGAVGGLAMDLVWYTRYRRGGGEDGFADWELATAAASFEEASAPGQVVAMGAGAVGIDLPDSAAGTATNVMHWLTGVGYGIGHGLLQHDRGAMRGGVLTGVGAFANSYAVLGAIGVYDPIWTYDPETLRQDLSAHAVFGLVTGLTYRLLVGRGRA
jgi:hypothetical protein